MKVYDNYEISGCHRLNSKRVTSPKGRHVETCGDTEAQFWTLYGHIDAEGVQAIGDFCSREAAEEVYSRITGIAFTGSYEADARLRVMHAGPNLLHACKLVVERWERGDLAEAARACQSAIAQATGDSEPETRRPIVIEVHGGVVQDVTNVPPGYEYEVKDYDNLDADEEASAGRSA